MYDIITQLRAMGTTITEQCWNVYNILGRWVSPHFFDDTKTTDKLFWKYDLETINWTDDNTMDKNDEELNRVLIIIQFIGTVK